MTIRHGPIAAVIAAQLCMLAAIPMRTLRTRAYGRDVTLWTAPVDPYDVMSGYYVTLAYEVERPRPTESTGADDANAWLWLRRGDPAWMRMQADDQQQRIAPDDIYVRARWRRRSTPIYNADRLYLPEADRDRATKLLREANGRGLVDLKVGPDGDVSVMRLHVGGATFGEDR